MAKSKQSNKSIIKNQQKAYIVQINNKLAHKSPYKVVWNDQEFVFLNRDQAIKKALEINLREFGSRQIEEFLKEPDNNANKAKDHSQDYQKNYEIGPECQKE